MAIIQIQDVSKKFQTKDGEIDALKHVTLDIEAGDIYGIIGMSGAGKSTLIKVLQAFVTSRLGSLHPRAK